MSTPDYPTAPPPAAGRTPEVGASGMWDSDFPMIRKGLR